MAFIYDLTDTWNAGGTTFNAIKMNVTDTASAAASKLITVQVSGSEKFSVKKDGVGYFAGNVGIGTSSPGAKLHVAGTSNFGGAINLLSGSQAYFYNPAGNAFSYISMDASNNVQVFNNAGAAIAFSTSATERLRITSAGSVGIGTSSPTSKLAVSGGNATAVTVDYNAGISTGAEYSALRFTASAVGFVPAEIRAVNTNGGQNLGVMQLFTSGSERMRIDSSGRLCVGRTDSLNNGTLSVRGTGSQAITAQVTADGNSLFQGFSSSGPVAFQVLGTGQGYFAGNVGIGTSSPGALMHVNVAGVAATSGGYRLGQSGWSSQFGYWEFDSAAARFKLGVNGASQPLTFDTNSTERMRIDSNGNLLVGQTSVSSTGGVEIQPDVSGLGFGRVEVDSAYNGTAQSFQFKYLGTGVGSIAQTTTSTSYNTSSDYRLKDNISDADDAANLIDAIQVRKFDWKADGSHQRYGMVAQELLEVAPEAVSVPQDEDEMMGVDYSKLVPMLVKEIQSLRARVAQLEG